MSSFSKGVKLISSLHETVEAIAGSQSWMWTEIKREGKSAIVYYVLDFV